MRFARDRASSNDAAQMEIIQNESADIAGQKESNHNACAAGD